MRTEHRSDGVTTYVYGPDERTATNVVEVRHSVDRIESLCRDILTALSLLVELLPEAHGHGNERSAGKGSDSHL